MAKEFCCTRITLQGFKSNNGRTSLFILTMIRSIKRLKKERTFNVEAKKKKLDEKVICLFFFFLVKVRLSANHSLSSGIFIINQKYQE